MTHCAGYRAAALARASDAFALGIDAEPHQPLPEGVLDVVARPEERSWIAGQGGGTGVWWDRLLFGAKEAVFKVWYPLTGRELDFDEAVVDFRPREVAPGHASGVFDARLLVPGPRMLTELSGRWLVRDGLSVTAIVLPARHPYTVTAAERVPPTVASRGARPACHGGPRDRRNRIMFS